MYIWVDANACSHVIKDLVYRAADRRRIALTLVANQPLHPHVALHPCAARPRRVRWG